MLISRLACTVGKLMSPEKLAQVALFVVATPAVLTGTLVAAMTAMIIVPVVATAMSFATAMRAFSTIGRISSVQSFPVSFTAGAVNRFTV